MVPPVLIDLEGAGEEQQPREGRQQRHVAEPPLRRAAVTIEKMRERKGQHIVDIEATIICERDSHKGIIIGKQGSMLKKIGSNARFEIEKMLEERVNLKIWVKVKKDWRDSDTLMKNFGYNKKEI